MNTIKTSEKYWALVGAAIAGVLLLSAAGMLSLSSAQPQEQGQEQQNNSDSNSKQMAQLKTVKG